VALRRIQRLRARPGSLTPRAPLRFLRQPQDDVAVALARAAEGREASEGVIARDFCNPGRENRPQFYNRRSIYKISTLVMIAQWQLIIAPRQGL
jgi:hypothetical protein